MIEIQKLIKNFGSLQVLKGVNLSAQKGELITLLGPNGAGKTTLMRIMCGYMFADEGSVLIDGMEFSKQRNQILRLIGYMPENTPLYPEMTVAEYLYFIGKVYAMDKVDFAQSLSEVVRGLELEPVLNQKIQTLSKGYRRRAGIASVLIHRPRYVILDEPTEGLDPNQKIAVRHFLKNYAQENLVLISTHLLEEAEALNGRVAVLSSGVLCYDGNVDGMRSFSSDGTLSDAFFQLTHSLAPKESK